VIRGKEMVDGAKGSRKRRIKCDEHRPVCGQCEKSHRQCIGFDQPNRLILTDETARITSQYQRTTRRRGTESTTPRERLIVPETSAADDMSELMVPTGGIASPPAVKDIITPYDGSTEWLPVSKSRMMPLYERGQVALYCCRETVTSRTLNWIMADEKWVGVLPDMMARSQALTSVIYANAANYFARVNGSQSPPDEVWAHYARGLKQLQKDLDHPLRQRSDETLLSIILLGVFEVVSVLRD
jgi:Fungal Zn(2)-Cys(6) binuclear cluster domain/Fungal specific transcription factor domain